MLTHVTIKIVYVCVLMCYCSKRCLGSNPIDQMWRHISVRSLSHRAATADRSEADNVNFGRYFVFLNVMGLLCPTFNIIMVCRTEEDVLRSWETSWSAAADRGNVTLHTGYLNERVLSELVRIINGITAVTMLCCQCVTWQPCVQ